MLQQRLWRVIVLLLMLLVGSISAQTSNQNLLTNGDFNDGLTAWQLGGDVTANTGVTNGVLSLEADQARLYAVAYQFVAADIPASTPYTMQVDLANPHAQPQAVTLEVSSGTDATRCTFVLPPQSSLQTYQLTGETPALWTYSTVELITSGDNAPIQADNAEFIADNSLNVTAPCTPAYTTDDITHDLRIAPTDAIRLLNLQNASLLTSASIDVENILAQMGTLANRYVYDQDSDGVSDRDECLHFGIAALGVDDCAPPPSAAYLDCYTAASDDTANTVNGEPCPTLDDDGCTTSCEFAQRSDPLTGDTDGDTWNDFRENGFGTHPLIADSDNDGYDDGFEISSDTDPLDPTIFPLDDDNDGLDNAWEIAHFGSINCYTAGDDTPSDKPTEPSGCPTLDADGCTNSCEAAQGSNPLDADTDDDGLGDLDEANYFTDPIDPDTDNDGRLDGEEVNGIWADLDTPAQDATYDDTAGYDYPVPQEYNVIVPQLTIDGVTAAFPAGDLSNTLCNINPAPPILTNPSVVDTDDDGYGDGQELYGESGANLNKTIQVGATAVEGTTVIDGVEETQIYTLDPSRLDTDCDGIADDEELDIYQISPINSDSDGDGINDGDEIDNGTDPVIPAIFE